MIEKEIKIVNINPNKLIKRLEKYGATRSRKWDITDRYFESKEMTGRTRIRQKITASKKKNGEKNTIITFKNRIKNKRVKECQELEVWFNDLASAREWLESAGMTYTWKKTKSRISYIYGDVQFDIDIYPDLPPLFEIEADCEKNIYSRVKKLWYSEDEVLTCGYQGLLRRLA